MVRIVAAAIALMAVFSGTVAARPMSAERLFHEFGLFGVWATDCAAAPSIDNPHVSVGMPQPGAVLEQHDFGPDYEPNRYVIVAARRLRDRRLALDALFEQDDAEPQRQLIIMHVENHTRRTMFTGTGHESPRVLNGIATATGTPTPVLKKCE
jgi:hypothetical protein